MVGGVGGWVVSEEAILGKVCVLDQNRKHASKKEDKQEQKQGVARVRADPEPVCVALRPPVLGDEAPSACGSPNSSFSLFASCCQS